MTRQGVPLATPSLLDRLIDAAPGVSVDPPRSRQSQTRDALDSLRRDLEALLNARRCPISPPSALPHLQRSLLSFGTADFLGANLVTAEHRRAFAARLQKAIREGEPRLQRLAVSVLDPKDGAERVLRLRIEATVTLDDGTVPVLFASSISPATMRFAVSEARDV